MSIKPLHDRVVVKPIEAEEVSAGGILIPDSAKEKSTKGEVVAVGPGKPLDNGSVRAAALKVGDGESEGVAVGPLINQAALNIAAEGESAVARWRAMLEAGSTRDPLGLAAIAGIDLSTPDALEHTIAYISGIIDEIAALTEEIDGITLD